MHGVPLCVVCQIRTPHRPAVCELCRRQLADDLAELPALLAEAITVSGPVDDRRTHRLVDGHLGVANLVEGWSDPVAGAAPAGPTASPGRVRVTGSRTPPLPIGVELLNIVGPGSASVTDLHGDQVGELPPRWWLLEVARDWADQLGCHPPAATVRALVDWLGLRLDWACTRHPSIADFAGELRRQRGVLRRLAGVVQPRPELCVGVACKRCDTRALWRAEGRVTCASCGKILEQSEYEEWVREQNKATPKGAAHV